jgi:hypothetical protein
MFQPDGWPTGTDDRMGSNPTTSRSIGGSPGGQGN